MATERIWKSPEIKPKDRQKISFKTKDSKKIYHGLYIQEEDMFFEGFGNESEDFFFTWGVDCWAEYKEAVWLVNVALQGQSLMFQFPTQEEQMKFVNEVKDRVDNVVYALESCDLVPMPEKEIKKK